MNWNDEPRAPRPGTPGGVPPQRPDRAAPRRVPPSPGPRHARGSVPPPAAGPSPDPGRGPEGGVRVEPRADRPGRIDETRYRQRHSGETDAVDSRASRNAGDEEASPTGLARDSDSSILRTSGSIAIATLFSRITGFLRTVLILAMLGSGIASAFQAADVLPNMIAEVVLGAVLTAIVIPLLARAEAEDPDGGQGFINRIFTITVVVLGTATVFAVIAAPALTYMNLGDGQVNRDLSTHLAYLLLPEILFYGLSALFIAILNVRGLFKPGAWAPVLNNVVQITTLVLYALVPGEITLNPVRMSDPQLLVLGVGCTLGVVLQAMVLVPFLKKAGVHLRLEWGIDARLRQFGNMAVAIVAYVALLQVGLVATYRIASSAEASGVSIYFTHWQLLQLPYGVLGVTILTAIMPRLSRNAAADNAKAVVDDLSLATRLTMVALVPVVSFMTFFGPAIAIAVFNFGRFEAADANQLGSVLAWGAFTLIPYSMTLVQLRVFYAREDAWTPTFIALGITVVKVGSSYLGPVLFDNPSNVVRWLALSNGLGYLVGAIVGHFLLRSRLGGARMTNVVRTTLVTFAVSIGVSATVWFVAKTTGLDGMIGWAGKLGSLIYLALTAAVVLAVTYAGLAAAQVPDVVAIGNSVRRVLGRFFPALAPPPEPEREQSPAITVAFPRVSADESLPYSGQVQVLRRFDRGTATWQSYSVHTGGAIGAGRGPRPIPPRAPVPRDIRYRRKGVRRVSDSELDTTAAVGSPADSGPGSTSGHSPTDVQTPENPVHANPATEATGAPTPPVPPRRVRPRGPRLVPGAVVAGGRYRLLERHGGSRGLQFWRALDINLDREVALTFVDAEQLAPPPEPGQEIRPTDQGPQAVLTRTLRLGQITHDGVARVLDVVRGSSGGIVVAEWVPGSSLAEVARTKPSPIGAARAVRSLAAAAEIAHRSGGALSIDHPDRIRISHDGNAVLAFPGTLAGDDKASDVRGLGAVLYALLLNRWTLDPETGSRLITTDDVTEPVGGIPVAEPGDDGRPREPRAVDPEIPFEISAVAARALDGTRGIRTAATVQHVLDQATVVDLNTDMLPAITDADAAPPVSVTPRIGSNEGSPKRRNTALLIGAGLLAIFVVIALIVGATNVFGGDEGSSDIDSIIPTSEPAPAGQPAPGADAPTAGPTQEIPLQAVSVLDFSAQTPDNPANVANVISGQVPVWQTDNYRGRPDFGGLKQGLGLMFDLGAERPVKSVTIDSPTPGFDVEIRTSPSATPAFARTTPVAAARVDSDSKTIELAEPATSRYVMVWITSLPESPNGGYQAQIAKVTMEG